MLQLLRYAFRVEPSALVLGVLVRIVGSALIVTTPVLFGQVIGSLPRVVAAGPDLPFAVLLVALLTVQLVCYPIGLVEETMAVRVECAVEKDTMLRLGRAFSGSPGLARLDDPDAMSTLQKIRGRKREIEIGVRRAQGSAIGMLVTLTGSAVALAIATAWWIPVVLVACWLSEAVFRTRLMSRELDVWRGQTEPQKHAGYAFALGMGRAPKEVRVFGLAGFLRERHWDNMTAAYLPYWRMRARHVPVSILVAGSRVAVTAAALFYTGWEASRGRLDLTGLATALPLILVVSQSDAWLFPMIGRAAMLQAWLEELAVGPLSRAVSSTRSAGRAAEPAVRRGRPPTITFDDVTFTYPGSDRPILDRLTLELQSSAAAALVGVNGAGKSTLVKLLAAGYPPDRGRVLVDGVDLAGLDDDARAMWQRRVAPITQDFAQLPLSAGDNVELGAGRIWAGRIDLDTWPGAAELDVTALEETSRQANAADLIHRLPAGWRTLLDKTFPGGTELSGGEWQRIAMARALRATAVGADVLVWDEPAAALDVEAEAQLVESYLDLTQHATSLVISHRFSVVRLVPLICVLEGGRIVERGSHAELMTAAGRYRTLFDLQASRYLEAADDAGRRL